MNESTVGLSRFSRELGESRQLSLSSNNVIDPRWMLYVTWALMFIGIALRLERYLLCYPLWLDELYITEGFLGWKSLASVWQPLPHCQVAPPLFLCIEWLLLQAFGYSEYVLRAFPFVMGIAAIFLLRHTTLIAFGPMVSMLATGIFAVSESVMDHVSEVKPYSSDVAVGLLFLMLAVYVLKYPQQRRWWWALAGLTPAGLALSFPSLFVISGINLALLPLAWRSGWKIRGIFAAGNLILICTFAFLYLTIIQVQESATRVGMQAYWQSGFLPWHQPWQIPGWLMNAFTGEVFAYPVGGSHGRSTLTLIAMLIGSACVYRQRSTTWLAVFTLPLVLALIAASLRRYPFGPSVRVSLFLAPMVVSLAALGLTQVLSFAQRHFHSNRMTHAYLAFLLLIATVGWINNLVQPVRVNREWQCQAFARWFWNSPENDIVLCAITDLKADVPRPPIWYRSSQRIYSPRHRSGRQLIDLSQVQPHQRIKVVVPRGELYYPPGAIWKSVREQLPFPIRVERIDNHFVKSRVAESAIDVYEITCLPEDQGSGYTPTSTAAMPDAVSQRK